MKHAPKQVVGTVIAMTSVVKSSTTTLEAQGTLIAFTSIRGAR